MSYAREGREGAGGSPQAPAGRHQALRAPWPHRAQPRRAPGQEGPHARRARAAPAPHPRRARDPLDPQGRHGPGRPARRPRREPRADGRHPRHAGRDQGPGARRQRRVGRLPRRRATERPAGGELSATYPAGRAVPLLPQKRPATGGPFLRSRPAGRRGPLRPRQRVRSRLLRARAGPRLCLNGRHAFPRGDPQGPRGRHRSRAAPLDRRARDGALDRQRRRPRARHGLADHAGLPDPQPLRDRRAQGGRRARRRAARRGRLRRPLRPGEGRAAAEARPPRRAAGGRAGPGRQRRLHRLGQGRRGQVHGHRQPRRRAHRRRQARRRPRRRRLGLLDPAHVRRLGPPARLGRSARSCRWRATA